MSVETVLVYGDIGYVDWWTGEGLTALSFRQALENAAAKSNEIEIRINSLGGIIGEGLAMCSTVRALINRKQMMGINFSCKTIVDGFAFSAAATLAVCGTQVIMNKGTSLMVHNASSGIWGYAKDLRKEADVLDKFTGQISGFYAEKSGKKAEDILNLMEAETYFTPEEALAIGLIDLVDESSKEAATNHVKRWESVSNQLSQARNHQMGYGEFYRDYMKSRQLANKASPQPQKKAPIDSANRIDYNSEVDLALMGL